MLFEYKYISKIESRQFSSFTVFKMKFLVLILAFTAVATASVINWNKYGLTNKQGVESIYGQGYTGMYSQYPSWNQFWNKNTYQQKYGKPTFENQEVYGNQDTFNRQATYGTQEFYGQNVQEILSNILFRIFNKQVWINLFSEYVYQQNWNQNVWDDVLYNQDIFDKDVLEQFIRQPVLRNILVQEKIFDKDVLQQILYTFNSQQTYDQVFLEQLVNKAALKTWLYNLGFYDRNVWYQYFTKKIYENTFNSIENGQKWLIQVVNNPEFRRFLVQQGVFNEEIVEQFLYLEKSQGVYDYQLLKQLVNKQVLRNFFVQHGFVDYNVLNKLISDEIFGLNVFLRLQFFKHGSTFSYRQVEDASYNPEYVFRAVQNFPVNDNFVEIDIKKTIVKPNKQTTFGDVFFRNKKDQQTPAWNYKDDKMNYLSNFNFGQQGYKFNGILDNFPRRQQSYNQFPVAEY